jgi:hypothetical protein
VHPVRFDERVGGHLQSYDGEPFEHPAAAFKALGTIAERRVACLSPEAQMSNHAWGYEPGTTDRHDMRLLHKRLGTPLLPPFNDQRADTSSAEPDTGTSDEPAP